MSQLQTRSPDLTSSPETIESGEIPRVLVSRVTKRFNNQAILRPIDLRIEPGEHVVLFGPNGAGKTTFLRMLSTLSSPTSGTLLIDGISTERDAEAVRRRVGMVAHQPYLYEDLTAEENLRFYARMYDLLEPSTRIAEVLELVGLSSRRHDRVRAYSRGMQQRLALARATLHRPGLLLLDEPDSGLDREGIRVLSSILREQSADGGSLLMTTHDLTFGLADADRVLLIESGRLVLDRPVEQVSEDELDRRLSTRT